MYFNKCLAFIQIHPRVFFFFLKHANVALMRGRGVNKSIFLTGFIIAYTYKVELQDSKTVLPVRTMQLSPRDNCRIYNWTYWCILNNLN